MPSPLRSIVLTAWIGGCLALTAGMPASAQSDAGNAGSAVVDAVPVVDRVPAADSELAGATDPYVTGIELTRSAQRELQRLEELWLQWMSAWTQKDEQRARGVVDTLLTVARELGFESLPDLSLGALVGAQRAAEEGDFERADWALSAAELFDPGQPETAFAHAAVNRLRGSHMTALGWDLKGLARTLASRDYRRLQSLNAVLWLLLSLVLAAVLFIALEMATHGGGLVRDAVRFADRLAPRWLAYLLAIVGLLWPLLLPYGTVWLLLYWSVLLWGYGTFSERTSLIAIWVLLALSPFVLEQCNRRAAVELAPPVTAIEHLRDHRLYGGMFVDLGVLRTLQPESVPVRHLLGDVHRLLGQWNLAQSDYRAVLRAEPDRASILVNLGAYSFLQGDYSKAIELFQQAVVIDPGNAAALYNLSQAYNEGFQYSESRTMLERAAAVDEARVSQWLKRAGPDRVLAFDGGVMRGPEIRRDLRDQRAAAARERGSIALSRRWVTPLFVIVLIAAAVGLHYGRRGYGYSDLPEWAPDSDRVGERLVRIFVPGLDSAQKGRGVRSFLACLLLTGLLLLPLGRPWLYRQPWGFEPGDALAWTVASVGLALWLVVRVIWELSGQGAD
jgi:tetratricopeptide (TPR) repeat protein